MSKDLDKYLHYYINSEIQIEYGYSGNKKVGILTGFRAGAGWEIWPYTHLIAAKNHDPHQIVRTDLVKPILRKLESMTKEEKEELEATKAFQRATPVHQIGIRVWTAESYHWAFKKGFDVFYLIEEGLAIDKETLKG